MANTSSMDKILTFKIGQINEFNNRLKYVIDGHVNQVTKSAEMWINKSEGNDPVTFADVNIQLDQAVMFFLEKTSEIESSLGPKPIQSGSAVTSSMSLTCLPSQINSGSQATDHMLCSLQERMDALENAASQVQELKTELDGFRKHVDSIEGMKANLENLALQVESIVDDTSLQELQQKVKSNKSKELTRMRKFEDMLCKVENTWNITDCQVKETNNSVSMLKEEISGLSILKEEIGELRDTSFRLDDRLSGLKKKSEETDDRMLKMDEKLSKAQAESTQMKELIDKEVEDIDKGSNQISVIDEKLSNLEIAIADIEENKLCCMDGRLLVVEEDMKKALEKKSTVECDGTLQTSDHNITETRQQKIYTGFTASIATYVRSNKLIDPIDPIFMHCADPQFIVKPYTKDDDHNGNFNEDTGTFTAPVNGT